MTCDNKLGHFLDILQVRLASIDEQPIKVTKKREALCIKLPFHLMAIYGAATALYDTEDVDFSVTIELIAAPKEEIIVLITIYPKLGSWAWNVFKSASGNVRNLSEIVDAGKLLVAVDKY